MSITCQRLPALAFCLGSLARGLKQKNPTSGRLAGSEGGAALSGLSKKKRINAALFAVFQQLIASGAGKGLEIGQ